VRDHLSTKCNSGFWKDAEPDDEENIAAEVDIFDFFRTNLPRPHHLPLVRLAGGRGSLADKYDVIMHAFFLIAFKTPECFCLCLSELINGCFDFGVEFGLPFVDPIHVETLFPWVPRDLVRRNRAQYMEVRNDDDFEDDCETNEGPDPSFNMSMDNMSGRL